MDNLHSGDRKVDRKGTRAGFFAAAPGVLVKKQKQRKSEEKLCMFITAGPDTKLLAGGA